MVGALCLGAGLLLAGCTVAETVAEKSIDPGSDTLQSTTARVTAGSEEARLAAIATNVEIIRDDFGVPHIYGKTDADAVFGLLYAQAEDDFPRIERNYVWAIGRLAEIEGESALFSDLRARLYMSIPEAQQAYEQAPPWLKALCNAFADGLNYYLLTHPEVQPKLLDRFEPWMPMFFFEGSIGGDIEQIPLTGIEAFYSDPPELNLAATPDTPDSSDTLAAATYSTDKFTEPLGSNGFAIAPEHTESGNALLLINPHTSFFFRGEVHVVSEEGLNAYGAVTWGQFFVYQGFNEHTGWMHTSTRADFLDEFVQTIENQDGVLRYRYGKEWRAVEARTIELSYRTSTGALRLRTFPGYRTHQGPITHAQDDGRWVTSRINWQPAKALAQSYLRMKQSGYDGFVEMMDMRTNSSNNTVYADSGGNIAYFHGNFMPRRSASFDYSKPVDGSDPATDWQGLHLVSEVIHLHNPATGWLQNCNSTPFTAAGESSPVRNDYPAYMAPDAENHRGIHAVQLLGKLAAQSRDGGKKLSLDGLIALAHDPYLPGFESLVSGLLSAWDAQNESSTGAESAALETLRDWDLRTRHDSVAMSLAHFYGLNMLETVEAPTELSRMARIDWLGTDSAPADRIAVFAATLKELEQKFGTWEVPWADVNRYQRLNGEIEAQFDDAAASTGIGFASGNWGALASFGAPRRDDVARLYGRYGNSFVAAVEFGDRVRAKTLLAGGQSGDPTSVHFADQVQRYADADFKEVAYYRDDVVARALVRYQPGIRKRQ